MPHPDSYRGPWAAGGSLAGNVAMCAINTFPVAIASAHSAKVSKGCNGRTGGPNPEWKWPRRKYKLAPFRKLRGAFRDIFLSGLKRLMGNEEVAYHRSFAEMEAELLQKGWVVNHQRPTAETKVIEEYLGRYICRIGISNKRLHYDKGGKNVRIEYNDYSRQEPGKAAPKKYRDLPPLVAMQLFLQHQLPPYFQRVRHYGLHSGVAYAKLKGKIPDKLKRNGYTVRTVIQILRALLAEEPYRCEHCGGYSFESELIEPSRHYLNRHVLHHGRSPPRSQVSPVEFGSSTGQARARPEKLENAYQ